MRHWLSKKYIVTSLLTICFLATPLSMAFAQDGVRARDDIKTIENRLAGLKTKDNGRYATEVNNIEAWLEEATLRLGKKEVSAVQTLNIKSLVYLDYVETSIKKDEAIEKAGELERQSVALKAERGKLEANVQTLKAEEKVLVEQLKALD